jgi:hypothetical protein
MYSSFDKEAGFSGSGGTFVAVLMEDDEDGSLLLLQLKVDVFIIVVVVDLMVVVLDVPHGNQRRPIMFLVKREGLLVISRLIMHMVTVVMNVNSLFFLIRMMIEGDLLLMIGH